MKTRYAKRLLNISIILLLLNFVFCCLMTRTIPINCCLCKKRVDTLSVIEYQTGPWKDIPSFHLQCLDHVRNYLAPNCDLSFSEWCEVRGYNPKSKKLKKSK